ncbi:hypothetical protein LOOC260_109650 [Paucilactobacillus hokkaidonensis JCM 18461]|uniref:Uncharacterized protein n=2 Tax=Paucilactobacillus hokkaidonensis TaxID=1193095 RepID=A0A0A1GX85_9LACO|nr:hypothetical protein [Paucilactobacillus hokkaidonensis]KRO07676.1 hypothetical protein IV59_GL001767 [Paucilactobacillus hokkaidonensis]BAP85504.1 hypothetical protein LOOC260_109650 [Paucilactobacillus hokkaidonensis JCM 18461]
MATYKIWYTLDNDPYPWRFEVTLKEPPAITDGWLQIGSNMSISEKHIVEWHYRKIRDVK